MYNVHLPKKIGSNMKANRTKEMTDKRSDRNNSKSSNYKTVWKLIDL